jgi:hypothetical protein
MPRKIALSQRDDRKSNVLSLKLPTALLLPGPGVG